VEKPSNFCSSRVGGLLMVWVSVGDRELQCSWAADVDEVINTSLSGFPLP
jgi:hypothetical protein